MNILNLFKSKVKSKVIKPKIQLELSDEGYYIVKAYGLYLTDTLTRDKDEAEKFYKMTVEQSRKKHRHTVIKETAI